MKPGVSSERAIILAPTGRDASVAAALIKEAGYYANTCADIAGLMHEIEGGAGLAVIADEAIKTADLRGLVSWLNDQPPWSDFPIVLLTRQGGGPERNPDAMRLGQILGNVTFIERPFHPTTLVSIVGSAVRARRRQYETRGILEDLTASESLLQTAMNAGHLGALELRLPDFELEASSTCKSYFGRDSGAPFTYQDLLGAVHPDDRERRHAILQDTVDTGRDYRIEYRVIWPDGSQHWVDVRARAVRHRDGTIKSLVGVCSDITARKTAEIERETLLAQLAAERTALADLTATLEQRVEQRTTDLMKEVAARERAQEQLRQAQKMEAIGQLTGGVAHDFNNLLMAVMGNLDLLRKRMPGDPRLHRLVDGALQGAERGASLTQRLLAFARQQDLRAVPVDLGALVRDMGNLLERSLGPRVALRLDIPEELPPASVDTNQLELAILNLAINARDAMPDGGAIDIRLAAWQARNDPTLRPGNYLKLSVVDTGIGMAADVLKRAIEPFFSSKPVGKGTGLGLSMVHGLAVQLGGALQLASTVGKGTTATLVLPVATSAPAPASPAPAPQAMKRTAVILLVDDDPLIAMSTAEMLEDLGHRVISANSGPHALDILRSDQPIDLMMTDHMMPGMTGVELATVSRQVRPQLPVLLATGYADLSDGTQVDLPRLAKPYHQDQLREQLDHLLGQGAASDQHAVGAGVRAFSPSP
ncbi:response regulator [Bradyrhizobium sp. 41S5]|uniref:ATP-binding protein n=1 Tax=Bradyrhizobium sp. 41S5 TaxID=1404443 RepID=UPI00156B3D68|nr:ATP-binding protein [Bradyrhizobium sp. 41S5]UFX44516.1 response regulator [Bradyrhizobium sp. 41S5]